jgi:hypothetical protein
MPIILSLVAIVVASNFAAAAEWSPDAISAVSALGVKTNMHYADMRICDPDRNPDCKKGDVIFSGEMWFASPWPDGLTIKTYCTRVSPYELLEREAGFVVAKLAGGTRPMYDIERYKACIDAGGADCLKSDWKEIPNQRATVGTECAAEVVRASSRNEFHPVDNGTVIGAALCKKKAGTISIENGGWEPLDIYASRFPPNRAFTAAEQAICDAVLTPVAAPQPAPQPQGGMDFTVSGLSDPLTGKVNIQAQPVNMGAIHEVDFLIDDELVNEEYGAPYTLGGDDGQRGSYDTAQLANGEHFITVVFFYDAADGNATSFSKRILVKVSN